MMLTKAQKAALVSIQEIPGKSGKFWRGLGIAPVTIARLEDEGLVMAPYRVFTGNTTVSTRSWSITDSGRKALEESE